MTTFSTSTIKEPWPVECFIAFLFFGFTALLVSGLGAGLGLSSGGSTRAYQTLAQRFGGVFQRHSVWRRPSVKFRYGPTWVTITPGPSCGQTRSTQAQINWVDRVTDVSVSPAAPFLSASPRATNTVPTGDELFDARFQILARHPEEARRLLSDGVRWQINKLYQFHDQPSLLVSIHNGRLLIEKPVVFRRSEDLEQFTQLCLELFDQAMLTRSEGIQFLGDASEAQLVENPICQVCGEEIGSDMVFCRRCRTPHHLDCWQYTGSCSIFGCRETRYAVPAVAQSVSPQDKSPEPRAE
jgi:hypothetical protein